MKEVASKEIQSTHYRGKVLPDGHLEIPQTVFEQMGLSFGEEVEVALRKAKSVETELAIPEEARSLMKGI